MLVGAGWTMAQGPAAAPAALPISSAVNHSSNYQVYPTIGDSGTMQQTPAPATDRPSCIPAEACAPGSGGAMIYADADYLLYKVRNGNIPPTASVVPVGLISVNVTDQLTTAPGGPIFNSTPSVVGFAPVSIVSNAAFGTGSKTDYGSQNGARFYLGFWGDSEKTWGLEAVGMFLDRGIDHFSAVSGESPNQFIIDTGFSRNLFLVSGTSQALLSSFPVLVVRQSQTSIVGNGSNDLYGGELNARCVGVRLGCVDFGGLLGFRYLLYKDELTVASNTSLVHPDGFPLTDGDASASLSQNLNFSTLDRIRIWNQFFGGQAGIDIDAKFGSFFINLRGKVAVGDMHQMAQVDGVTMVVNNDPTHITPASSTTLGGLLSSPADSGQHIRDRFTYIPEMNLKVGYQFTNWLRGYVGYDVMVIGNAARAGDSTVTNTINTAVSVAGSNNNITIAQPTFRFQDRDVMIQGLTFGMELTY